MFQTTYSLPINWLKKWVLALFAMLFFPLLAYAAPDLSVSSISAAPGGTVTVYVTGDFTQSVNAIQFSLSYDSTVLSLANVGTCSPASQCSTIDANTSSVTTSSGNSSWIVMNHNNYPSSGTLTVSMFNPPAKSGWALTAVCSTGQSATCTGQQIAAITFNVLSSATNPTSSLTLSNANFYTTVTSGSNCTQNACATGQVCNVVSGFCEAELNTPVSTLNPGVFTLNSAVTNYNLTVNLSGSGTVLCNGGSCSAPVPSGTTEVFSETPGSTATFTSWSGVTCTEGSQTGSTCTVVVNSNVSILATFSSTPSPFNITAQPSAQTVDLGQTASFSVGVTGTSPTYQWYSEAPGASGFRAISGANSSSYTTSATTAAMDGTQYECIITNTQGGSVTTNLVSLTLKYQILLTTNPSNIGISAVEFSSSWWVAGSAVTYTANPPTGDSFTSWTGDMTGAGANNTLGTNAAITFTMPKNTVDLVANFNTSPTSYDVTINAANGGLSAAVNGQATSATSFPSGTTVTFTANPNSQFFLYSWTVSGPTPGSDCAGTGGTCTLTITKAATVTPKFLMYGDVLGVGVTTKPTLGEIEALVQQFQKNNVPNFITKAALVVPGDTTIKLGDVEKIIAFYQNGINSLTLKSKRL